MKRVVVVSLRRINRDLIGFPDKIDRPGTQRRRDEQEVAGLSQEHVRDRTLLRHQFPRGSGRQDQGCAYRCLFPHRKDNNPFTLDSQK